MIKIEEGIVQNGALFRKGYKAVLSEGASKKDAVRYHIDHEVGDVYDLIADLSKMIWILDRKVNNESLPTDEKDTEKLKERMAQIDTILSKYYSKD